MKRIIISLAAGLSGGIAIGFALGIFIYPYWFLNDIAAEALSASERRTKIAAGEFIHANPSDPIHWGKGGVTIYRNDSGRIILHLEKTFQVGPGPRFHVYLADAADIKSNEHFEMSGTVDLGRLRAFQGSQVYEAPVGTEIGDYRSVVIWCKEFGVLISPATLASASADKTHRPGRALRG